jgi:hypothetical protein
MRQFVVRPFANYFGKVTGLILGVALLVVLALAVPVFAMLKDMRDPAIGMMLVAGMVLPTVVVLGMVGFAFWSTSRREWTVSDVGVRLNARRTITWAAVAYVDAGLSVVTRNSRTVASLILGLDPDEPLQSVVLPLEGSGGEAMRGIIGIVLERVPAERISPAVLVLQSMLEGALAVGNSLDSSMTRLRAHLESGNLRAAIDQLQPLSKAGVTDTVRRQAALLLSQAYVLNRRYSEADIAAAKISAEMPQWNEPRIVRAVALVGLLRPEEAAAQLRGVSLQGVQAQVIDAAIAAHSVGLSAEQRREIKRMRWVIGLAFVPFLLWIAARILIPMGDAGVAWASPLGTALAVCGTVGALLFAAYEVSVRSRRQAARSTAVSRATVAPFPPVAVSPAPVSPAGNGAKIAVVGSFSVGALLIVAMVAVRVAGTLAPGLLGKVGGEWLSVSRFEEIAEWGITICFLVLLWGVRLGALRSPARTRQTPLAASPGPGVGAPKSPMLNANLSTGWVVAALSVAGVCAVCALALAAWNAPTPQCMTTDLHGDIYAVLGDRVYRWTPSGSETTAADLHQAPRLASNICDLRVGPDGTMYVADMNQRVVQVFSAGGVYLRSLASGQQFTTPGEWEWDVSAASSAGGTVLMDRGTIEGIDELGRTTSQAHYTALDWAQDVDVAPDGTIYVADTTHGCVARIKDGVLKEVSCLGLADGYCYPSVVRVSPTGEVYAVTRKRWGYNGGPDEPLAGYKAPPVWMGRLCRVDFSAGTATAVPVTHGGQDISVDYVGFLGSGAPIVTSLNEGWIYRVAGAGTDSTRLAQGTLGEHTRTLDALSRAEQLGPNVFWALAVIAPILIGIAGARAGRKPTAPPTSHLPVRPAPSWQPLEKGRSWSKL